VNVPFINVLSQMPTYVLFLKEVLSKKSKIDKHETIALDEECNAIVLNKLHVKLKDPSCFSIPCLIGNVKINRAFCNLCSSVSFMPYSIFKRFGLGELRPTTI